MNESCLKNTMLCFGPVMNELEENNELFVPEPVQNAITFYCFNCLLLLLQKM